MDGTTTTTPTPSSSTIVMNRGAERPRQPSGAQQQRPQPQPYHRLQRRRTWMRVRAQTSPSHEEEEMLMVADEDWAEADLDFFLNESFEWGPVGGAPGAPAEAIARLEVRELDDEMVRDWESRTGDGKGLNCVVCLEGMAYGARVAVLPCTHVFHRDCVRPWLVCHDACPVCRRSICAPPLPRPRRPKPPAPSPVPASSSTLSRHASSSSSSSSRYATKAGIVIRHLDISCPIEKLL